MSDNSKYVREDPFTGNITFPRDVDLDIPALIAIITNNQSKVEQYQQDQDYYNGKHAILNSLGNVSGINKKLVVNMPYYLVNTFNGYFIGNEPTIALDDDKQNEQLNDWLNINSFQDKLNEVSKEVDIVGKWYMYLYQNEQSETKVATISPDDGVMVYDDTIEQKPLAFIRMWKSYDNEQCAEVSFADKIISYNTDNEIVIEERPNLYHQVPAVEFYANEERASLFEPVKTLCAELDEVMSSKANQVAYFDNAYLKILGLDLTDPETGEVNFNIANDRMLYSPDPEAANADVGFVEKPDGDTQQEHLIERLTDMIFQTSMISNLNDKVFSGNSSGVALEYKLLPMKNLALNKERKFTQQLRQLLSIVLGIGTVVGGSSLDCVKDLSFTFTRNIPTNVDSEADAAQKLTGIVSQETQLAQLSFVKDPKKEIKQMHEEEKEKTKNAIENSGADYNWSNDKQDKDGKDSQDNNKDKKKDKEAVDDEQS